VKKSLLLTLAIMLLTVSSVSGQACFITAMAMADDNQTSNPSQMSSENYILTGGLNSYPYSTPEQKPSQNFEHELDVGTGIWNNSNAGSKGDWWYGEYKLSFRNLSTQIGNGYLTPRIGIFARGDFGETDQDYEWNNWGIGPQAGFIWTGKTDTGYPHQIQLNGRLIWENNEGENKTSGYKKTEDHLIPGYYLEYLRQFQPEWLWIIYSEGWFDGNGNFQSTWAGDKISDRTSLTFGGKIHKDFSPDWAGRLGVQYGMTPENNRKNLGLNAEARYREWLIFGPLFDYNLNSDDQLEKNSWSAGLFVRLELIN